MRMKEVVTGIFFLLLASLSMANTGEIPAPTDGLLPPTFNVGQIVAVCDWKVLSNNNWDYVCLGPYTIVKSTNENGEYLLSAKEGQISAKSKSMAWVISEYGSLKRGDMKSYRRLSDEYSPSYKIINLAYAHSGAVMVQFEGHDEWILSSYLN